ncbi:hypothetical protein MKEN_00574000 [Mycena kentingensis (nom. inval.)]|nr:hypothetical protein MKEN_00574000 [Mycena kentingensis (nom. inval.)]
MVRPGAIFACFSTAILTVLLSPRWRRHESGIADGRLRVGLERAARRTTAPARDEDEAGKQGVREAPREGRRYIFPGRRTDGCFGFCDRCVVNAAVAPYSKNGVLWASSHLIGMPRCTSAASDSAGWQSKESSIPGKISSIESRFGTVCFSSSNFTILLPIALRGDGILRAGLLKCTVRYIWKHRDALSPVKRIPPSFPLQISCASLSRITNNLKISSLKLKFHYLKQPRRRVRSSPAMATAQRTANVQAIYNAILLSPAYFSFPIETCNIPAVAGPLSPATGAPRDTFSLTFTETAKFWRWDAEFDSHIYASFVIPIALADTLRGFYPDGALVRAGLLHSCATNQQASLRRGGKAEVVVRLNSGTVAGKGIHSIFQ